MKIIVVSNCTVLREGLLAIISKHSDVSIRFVGETVNEAMLFIKGNMADVLILDIHENNEEELNIAKEIRNLNLKIKMMVLDFYSSNELFLRALKYGAHGYVSGKSNEEELMYAMNQVYKGKRYYDACFIDYVLSESNKLPN